jgi:uncharacterized protein YjbI with pentapeptide repeats
MTRPNKPAGKRNEILVATPRMPATMAQGVLESAQINDGTLIRQMSFERAALIGARGLNVILEQVAFSKSNFAQADLPSCQITDARFSDCEFSGALFIGGSFHRTEYSSCRMTGFQPGQAYLKDVLFFRCKLDHSSFRFAEMESVIFRECDLRGADFQEATLTKLAFEKCDLSGVELRRCKMANVDFRSSEIREIKGVEGLKGALIDSGQLVELAPAMAAAIGIRVDLPD